MFGLGAALLAEHKAHYMLPLESQLCEMRNSKDFAIQNKSLIRNREEMREDLKTHFVN